jgi:hypothetical protein
MDSNYIKKNFKNVNSLQNNECLSLKESPDVYIGRYSHVNIFAPPRTMDVNFNRTRNHTTITRRRCGTNTHLSAYTIAAEFPRST